MKLLLYILSGLIIIGCIIGLIIYFVNKENFNTNQTLVIEPTAGLCNRLRTLFSYLQLARRKKTKLIVIWKLNKHCNGYFEDFFEIPNNVIMLHDNQNDLDVDYTGYGFAPNYKPKTLYNEMKLLPQIKYKVSNMIDKLNPPFIALHVRKTDIIDFTKTYVSDDIFIKFVEKYPDYNIFLATDNYDTQRAFIEKYKHRIFYNKLIIPNNNYRQTNLENAILDIYVASHATHFQGTDQSSFSMLIKKLSNDNDIPLSPKLSINQIKHLKKSQQKMTIMLEIFDSICNKYNITYFLIGGSLIGAVAYKGWVPWDGDVDLEILDTDWKKLQTVLKKELPKHMWLQTSETDVRYRGDHCIGKIRDLNSCYTEATKKNAKWHNGLQIDLNLFCVNNDGSIYMEDNKKVNYLTENDIYPLKRVPFDNIMVWIPNNAKKYLINNYGKTYYNDLPIKKRYPHEGIMDSQNTCMHHYKLYPNMYSPKNINKIFEIGVMKTGTTSLGKAYEILGYRHCGWTSNLHDYFQKSNKNTHVYQKLFKHIDKYDAFEDGPWHELDYKKLDTQYPNSKFILLERDDASWIKSMESHTSPKYNVNEINKKYLNYDWLSNRNKVIKEKIKWKNDKYNNVKQYFKDRPNDLLCMNIKDGWKPLCTFLNKPIPKRSFPKTNVSK